MVEHTRVIVKLTASYVAYRCLGDGFYGHNGRQQDESRVDRKAHIVKVRMELEFSVAWKSMNWRPFYTQES